MSDNRFLLQLIEQLREESVEGETYRKSAISLAEQVDEANRRMDDLEQRIEVLEHDSGVWRDGNDDINAEMLSLQRRITALRRVAIALAVAMVLYAIAFFAGLQDVDSRASTSKTVDLHVSCPEEVILFNSQGR